MQVRDALTLMIGFGMLIIALLGLGESIVTAINKTNVNKTPSQKR